MQTDSHFMIGHTHTTSGKPCQDYATSDVLSEGSAYAIVSDGCSTGRETDIGARLVSLATKNGILWFHEIDPRLQPNLASTIMMHQDTVLQSAQSSLGCQDRDLLATSVSAYYGPTGGFAYVQGDGVVAWQTKSGLLRMRRFDWQPPKSDTATLNAAPFYPVYRQDGCKQFISYYGGDLSTLVFRGEGLDEHTASDTPPTEYSWLLKLQDGINGTLIRLDPNLRYVAVFTDGVTQVDGLDWKDAVRRLLSFKSTQGLFAKRRMSRFVAEVQKTGKGPLDDIGFAVIYNEEVDE